MPSPLWAPPLFRLDAMTEASNPVPDTPGAVTAGQWLREARTRQGVHLAVLSAALKVPVRSLEHLEADRHEELPGATFVRALAQSVCRQLRLDPAPVLALLPEREGTTASAPPSLQTRIPVSSQGVSTGLSRQQLAYAALVAMMLIVIGGLLWWPERPEAPGGVSGPGAMNPSATTSPSSETASLPEQAASAASLMPLAPPTAPQDLNVGVSLQPSAATTASPPPGGLTPPSAGTTVTTPMAQPALGTPTLRLLASGECWVEVRDAANQIVFSALMQAGQRQDVVQPGPLKVVLGNAAVMQVQVRGQGMDLAPHTKVTVARFEVQP